METSPQTVSNSPASKTAFPILYSVFFIMLCSIGLLIFWLIRPTPEKLKFAVRRALNQREIEQAVQISQQLVARFPEEADHWGLLAQSGLLARDRSIWTAAMEKVEELSPDRGLESWIKFGSEAMQRMQASVAEIALRRAIEIDPDRPEPWRLFVQLVSIQGRPRETVDCLLSLIRLGDFTSQDLQMLAWPNSAVDDPTRVSALLDAEPENRIPMLARVGAALNENRTADAELILEQILEYHPDNSRAIALTDRLLASRDAAEFLKWRRSRSNAGNIEPESWIGQGVWLRRHGQLSAATRCFRRAVELDPRHLDALSELGQSLLALGQPAVGAEVLDRARQQQEIMELAKRVEEKGELQTIRKLVDQLQQVGRFWEAWAWGRLYANSVPNDKSIEPVLSQLKNHLITALPRTAVDYIPGKNFDWKSLAAPDWEVQLDFSNPKAPIQTTTAHSQPDFQDLAVELGIHFHFENGPEPGGTIVQTSGGGVAAIDYDRDGWCDLYFTQGGPNVPTEQQPSVDSLFRNLEGIRYQNVTTSSTISEDRFSQGIAAGDYDNDGFQDLYIANLGLNRLLRNNGDGTFSDVTDVSGLRATGWTTSCAFADFNHDSVPDLFSVRYAQGSEIATRVCRDPSGRAGVCRPTLFPAEPDILAVGTPEGRFNEQCQEVGLDLPDGRGFGLVIGDFNEDQRLDVFVANDQTANYLLIQKQARSGQLMFADEAVVSGLAFDRDGYPQACMGIAAADINQDLRPDLFVTNFADESDTLYVSQPYGGYLDMTREADLRDASFRPLGFGTQFLDADLDGWHDLIVLNGHILDDTEHGRPQAMLPQLYQGLADSRFRHVIVSDPKHILNRPRIGRGLCILDWNRDGLPDFASSYLDGNAAVVKNISKRAGNWLTLEFVGTKSSRDAIGTRVIAKFSDRSTRYWQLTAGDGFAASNERRMTLGLGDKTSVESIEIEWPSGQMQKVGKVDLNRSWLAIEGVQNLIQR